MAGLGIWHVLTQVERGHVRNLQELRLRVSSVLLSERLKGVSLLRATHLFVACAPSCVLNHSDDLLILIVQSFEHLATGLSWPLSGFPENL